MARAQRKPRPHEERASDTGYELSDRAKSIMLSRSPLGWGDPANHEVYNPAPSSRVPEIGARPKTASADFDAILGSQREFEKAKKEGKDVKAIEREAMR